MTSTRVTDAAIDALYQAPLDQFVARRNALATDLRKAGDRAGADEVKALAKPSVIAWAVNQAWWRDRAAVQRVFDATAAQRAAHGTGTADVRAAADARAEAVKTVIDLAVTALGGPTTVTPDARHRLVGTVEALAAGGWPEGVGQGRLVRELQPTGLEAFGLLATLAGAAPPSATTAAWPTLVRDASQRPGAAAPADRAAGDEAPTAPPPTRPHPTRPGSRTTATDLKRQAREKQRDAGRTRLASLESALEAAARDVAARAADEQQARAAADAAAARVVEAEVALEQAREAARAARRAASAATAVLGEAELTRARTARDVAHARAALDALEDD